MATRKHPTHSRNTAIGVLACASVGLIGGGLAAYVGECANHPLLFAVGVSGFGLGALAFICWALFRGLFLRCPTCNKLVFKLGESYPNTKKFHCKRCDTTWDSGEVIGGPD